MDIQLPHRSEQTLEDAAVDFRNSVRRIAGGSAGLATKMVELGDQRNPETISRSIQRMAAGEVRVSGEMRVILELLGRQKARGERLLEEARWVPQPDGGVTAQVQDFSIAIAPAKGRWRAELRHSGGYSPPWPRWKPTLAEAKHEAIQCLLKAEADLDEMWAYEHRGDV